MLQLIGPLFFFAALQPAIPVAPCLVQNPPRRQGRRRKRRDPYEPLPRETPTELEEEDEKKAFEELESEDAAVRKAAFLKLYYAHRDKKLKRALSKQFKEASKEYQTARKRALKDARPLGGGIGALRSKAEHLFKQEDTRAMRPLVEDMFRHVYPDWSKMDADPDAKAAEAKLKELDIRLVWIGETRRNMADVIEKLSFEVDAPEWLRRTPGGGGRGGTTWKEYKVILITNAYRVMMGRTPLRINGALCSAAREHSRDMKNKGFFSHTSPVPGKKTPSDRARRAGTSCVAENIARAKNPWGAFWGWFLSLGHHKNMLRDYVQIGLGEYEGYWTENF